MTDQLADRIRSARDDAGMTRENMAPQLGVAVRTLSRWESGETQGIRVEMVAAIARLTGKPMAFFVSEEAA